MSFVIFVLRFYEFQILIARPMVIKETSDEYMEMRNKMKILICFISPVKSIHNISTKICIEDPLSNQMKTWKCAINFCNVSFI